MTKRFNKILLKPRRRELRSKATLTETILWHEIRNRKMGPRFIRQYSVDGYVIDFYCPEHKLGIEIEGSIHQKIDIKKYDAYRERFIKAFNIRIIKFSNTEVSNYLPETIRKIKSLLFPLSLPKRGG